MRLVGLAAWCGLVAGLLEVLTVVVHKRFFDTNQILGMTRHFTWLVPLADVVIFVILGLGCGLVMIVSPAAGRFFVTRALGTLTALPVLLVAFPQVYGAAWLFVALGLSIRIVPMLERWAFGFGRVVIVSSPVLAVVFAWLAIQPVISDMLEQSRENHRPIPRAAPNVLLVVMDTVAADHLALYGYGRPTSVAIDELARRGSRFDGAVASSSWTLPSHASMFTGKWPHELSVGWRTPLDTAELTVAEFLRDHGYATAGFVANMNYCAADSGLGRGFTVYRDYLFHELSPFRTSVLVQRVLDGSRKFGFLVGDALGLDWLKAVPVRVRERFETDRKEAAVVNREFLGWLANRSQPERPYFAFLNYSDAHTPYQLSPLRMHRFGVKPSDQPEFQLIQDWWTMDKSHVSPQELGFVLNSYDDCVASVDEQVGRLFDELERRRAVERTWVIILSDHGESFGEHAGVFLHGGSLYRTELHVPLVVIPPPGTKLKPVVSEAVSLRNMAATIADLAGLGANAPFPGGSLARVWGAPSGDSGDSRVEAAALAELVPNETLDPAAAGPIKRVWPLGGLTEGGWSYIRREGELLEELYHLADDPREERNVAGADGSRSRLEQMRQTLSRWTAGPLTPERFNP